ncbi:hypothetical protein [Kutzneria buriramensis]|uniref:Type VII secretion system (Wss) protein ESAT-6 n=1 Tax=Kutzneria buriramensis TaxID=1045776 RepID=A0A3E0HQ11_9PSEU|nr:hypothetical protein [Kutzneria buriramensis]REH48508.1 hypothetical protein BCF44_105367 [Kutzneria buriramensis]
MATETMPDLKGEAPAESPTSGFDGSGIFSDVANTAKDVAGGDALGMAMDGAASALDTLGFVEDPLGSLLSAGIGWLIEHVEFLRKPLDLLAGNPGEIAAQAATWTNIGAEMKKIGEDYLKSIESDIPQWKSGAAESYRAKGKELAEALSAFSEAADGAAGGITLGGVLVGTERGIIRDLVSTFIGKMIERAIIALAASWCTFGGTIAAFIADAVAEGSIVAGKCASRISKVLNDLAQLANKFGKLGHAIESLALKMKSFAKDAGQLAGKVKAAKPAWKEAGEQFGKDANKFIRGKAGESVVKSVDEGQSLGDFAKDTIKDGLREQFTTGEDGDKFPAGLTEAGRQSHEAKDHTEEANESAEKMVEKQEYPSRSGSLAE